MLHEDPAAAMAPALSFAQAAPDAAPAAAVSASAPSQPTPVAAVAAAIPLPGLSGSDQVGPVILRDETVAQVLDLMQRWTGKSILRPQALPASNYTLSLPAAATRDATAPGTGPGACPRRARRRPSRP